jgi:hypothetical protein
MPDGALGIAAPMAGLPQHPTTASNALSSQVVYRGFT